MNKAIVYILKSKKNNRFYVGSTNNIKRRLEEHTLGMVTATKYIRPLELKFSQEYKTLQQARKVEYKIKKLKRKDILERIIKEGKIILGS